MKALFTTVVTAAILVGCGGGGAPSTTATSSAPSATILSTYSEISGAMVGSGGQNMLALIVVPLDVNGDGHDDLVVHYWSNKYWGTSGLGSTPCENYLRVYVHTATDQFEDQTTRWINGPTTLGGCSRKYALSDINGDGRPDIVFTISQEDGRIQSNPIELAAPLAALVSSGGSYTVQTFGRPNWYHSLRIGTASSGQPLIVANGFAYTTVANTVYEYARGLTPSVDTLPTVSSSTFELLNTGGSKTTNLLVQPSPAWPPENMTVDAWSKQGTAWTKLTSAQLAPQSGSVQFVNYNGTSGGTRPAYKFANGYFVGSFSESCAMSLRPGTDPVVILKADGTLVPAASWRDGMTLRDSDYGLHSTLRAVKVVDGRVVEVPLNISGEITSNVNAYFMSCRDLNGDGWSDIVIYQFNNNGIPHVYLNDRNGGFKAVDQGQFPVITERWGNTVTSLLHDFNKDGYQDLLYWPGAGITSSVPVPYRYYRGNRHLAVQ